MPNWCQNVLEVSHTDQKMIDQFVDATKTGLFQTLIPCPNELIKTLCGRHSDKRKQRRLDRTIDRNIKRYGFCTWYDWRKAHWGIKWDVDVDTIIVTDDGIRITFDSPWNPPIEAYDTLRDMGYYIKAYYYESGMAFAGIYEDGCASDYEVENAKQAQEELPADLNDMFDISSMLSEFED